MKTISYVDSAGLGVSSLCIIHCLFLPILGGLGAILLTAAAFMPQFHDVEAVMTLFGGLALGLAHTLRLLRPRHSH